MANFTYSTAHQDQIALLVDGVAYTNLDTKWKTLIDGSSTTPGTSSTAHRVLLRIKQITQYLAMAGVAAAPDAVEPWFIAQVLYEAGQVIRPERTEQYRKMRDDAENTFFASFSNNPFDATAEEGGEASSDIYTLHLQNIRKYVVLRCLRRKDRLMPPIYVVDGAVQKVLNEIWNSQYWIFRRRKVTITIATTSVVTNSLTAETIDKVATRKFYYNDSTGAGTELEWLERDAFHRIRAALNATSTTGRPRYFTTQQAGDTWTWTFIPAPDQQYTAMGEVYVVGPGTPGSATETTIFAKFPAAFAPYIRKGVLAEVLRECGAEGGEAMRAEFQKDMETLLPTFADVGMPNDDPKQRDVYGDSPWSHQDLFGVGPGL